MKRFIYCSVYLSTILPGLYIATTTDQRIIAEGPNFPAIFQQLGDAGWEMIVVDNGDVKTFWFKYEIK